VEQSISASSNASPGASSAQEEAPLLRLSPRGRALCWAIVVALFLFDTGPLWQDPWNIVRLDRAIFWSYAPIPLLVFGGLLWSKRLSLRAFFLDTLEITLLKYVTTFAIALVLWEVTPAPVKPPPPPAPRPAMAMQAEPQQLPTSIDPALTGRLHGRVLDAANHPVPGALVFIAGGLEGQVFAPPAAPVELSASARGVGPDIEVALAGQPLFARSTDGHLHTVVGMKEGATLFNVPLLSQGTRTALPLRDITGLVTLHCNVHPGPEEANGRVLILAHPFFTRSDGEGRFALRGVPAGRLRVAVLLAGGESREEIVELRPGGEVKMAFVEGEEQRAQGREPR